MVLMMSSSLPVTFIRLCCSLTSSDSFCISIAVSRNLVLLLFKLIITTLGYNVQLHSLKFVIFAE